MFTHSNLCSAVLFSFIFALVLTVTPITDAVLSSHFYEHELRGTVNSSTVKHEEVLAAIKLLCRSEAAGEYLQ